MSSQWILSGWRALQIEANEDGVHVQFADCLSPCSVYLIDTDNGSWQIM